MEDPFTQDTALAELEQLRMKATLTSCAHPEYGEGTIPFPIPDQDYDRMIDQLRGLDIGDTLAQDCRIVRVESQYPVLTQLEGTLVNVDELDYLARRMNCLYWDEETQFFAMAHKLQLSDVTSFINLAFCCHKVTVITDFSDLEQIGWDHRMVITGGDIPAEDYPWLDNRKAALTLIENQQGTVTPYGVVYDNGMVLEQHYNGHQFPAYPYDSSLMVLEVTPQQGLAEGKNPEYLYLPAATQQIERTLLRAGVDAPHNTQVRLDFDELPDIVADKLDLEHLSGDDIPDLNRMCRSIQLLAGEEIEKLNAVVLMAGASGAGPICRLAENLDQFDFIPSTQTQESGGQLNECGYVSYHGAMPLEALMREEPAK